MKKLATFVFALLLAGSLSFGQAGGTTPAAQAPAGGDTKADTAKKPHKKGKKHAAKKKKAEDSATPAPAAPK